MGKLVSGFMYIYLALLWLLGGLMHIWTIYIAYKTSGVFWGIINFFFPIVSQIIWGYRAWVMDGFNSPYIQWLIVLVILWLVYHVFVFIISLFDRDF